LRKEEEATEKKGQGSSDEAEADDDGDEDDEEDEGEEEEEEICFGSLSPKPISKASLEGKHTEGPDAAARLRRSLKNNALGAPGVLTTFGPQPFSLDDEGSGDEGSKDDEGEDRITRALLLSDQLLRLRQKLVQTTLQLLEIHLSRFSAGGVFSSLRTAMSQLGDTIAFYR
jgi:hypothetical protein